jgi:hypothetical protein
MIRTRLGALVATVALGMSTSAGSAYAADRSVTAGGDYRVTMTATTPSGDYTSSAVVTFADAHLSAAQKVALRRQTAMRMSVPGIATGAPSKALIHCNKFYRFTDGNGAFTIQRNCASTKAPWGYRIGPTLCAVVVSPVREHGMVWTRNGALMPRQAPHTVGCTYTFHGTFNPAKIYDKATYVDLFDFTVNVGGHVGSARLTIRGSYTYVGPCSPTSC